MLIEQPLMKETANDLSRCYGAVYLVMVPFTCRS